jgi:hypothetical protein
MNSKFAGLFVLLAVIAVSPVGAKENYHEKTVNADTKEKFVEIATNVRQEMEGGGRYEYVKVDERKTIDQKLTEMETLFNENGTVQSMKQDTKVKLFNDQEIVNSILTRRDRDRVICKNEAPLGSHIPVTTCHTYGQEVEAQEGTHNQLDEWKRGACRGKVCAGK